MNYVKFFVKFLTVDIIFRSKYDAWKYNVPGSFDRFIQTNLGSPRLLKALLLYYFIWKKDLNSCYQVVQKKVPFFILWVFQETIGNYI